MTRRLLVVWEDEYFQPLERIVNRAFRGDPAFCENTSARLLHGTAGTNGQFDRYVQKTWRNVRPTGLPRDPGLIDHILCIVDGDRIDRLIPELLPKPKTAVDVGPWHARAELLWQERLRAVCDPSVPAGSVHGIVLRWCKESFLLAGYDQKPFHEGLGVSVENDGVRVHLAACEPRPASVQPSTFTDSFRNPFTCVKDLRRAQGESLLDKNSPEIDDVLRALSKDHLDTLRERVPDLPRIVARLHAIAAIDPFAPFPPAAPPVRAPKKRSPKLKASRKR